MTTAPSPVPTAPARIGPGRLVLVVGASGAGKDTLIAAAREALAGDDHYVFPRRVVTRPPSAAENNRELDPAAFAKTEARGGFAMSWSAHGLSYGLPVSIDADIAKGRTVLCNVSRTVVDALRERYGNVLVVAVMADPAVLAARLAGRKRDEDGDLAGRLERSATVGGGDPDRSIDNSGPLESATEDFLEAVR